MGGLAHNPGDFHEMMRNGSYIVPVADISGDERTWQEKWLVPTIVGTVFTLLPVVINNFAWLPVIGAVLILIGLFRLWTENSWFKLGFAFAAALLLGSTIRAFQSLFAEDAVITWKGIAEGMEYELQSFARVSPMVALLGFGTVLCMVLGVRRYAGYMTAWVVLAPVSYGALLILGLFGTADWVLVSQAAAAVLTAVSYFKVYRMIT